MSRKAEYRRYLKSPEWAVVRNHALARDDGLCAFCGELAAQVHHVQYPKQFGHEHPHSTVAICEKCHKTAHGIPTMKPLTNVEKLHALAPGGLRLNYLLSEGRVYASAASWRRALGVPSFEKGWFDARLAGLAIFKRNSGDELERSYDGVAVYRWRVVVQALRNFSFAYMTHGFKLRPLEERRELEQFHEKFERLVEWGDDLQEHAIASALRSRQQGLTPGAVATVSEVRLATVIAQAVAPRLNALDHSQTRQDVVIAEIKEAVPALQPHDDFITAKQAIAEKGLDPTVMPLHPRSSENLSGLVGQMLTERGAAKGAPQIARIDGTSRATAMNTYRRGDIYSVLEEIMRTKQEALF